MGMDTHLFYLFIQLYWKESFYFATGPVPPPPPPKHVAHLLGILFRVLLEISLCGFLSHCYTFHLFIIVGSFFGKINNNKKLTFSLIPSKGIFRCCFIFCFSHCSQISQKRVVYTLLVLPLHHHSILIPLSSDFQQLFH